MEGTKHFGPWFENSGKFNTIVGSGDTDWATAKDTRKSVVCGVIKIDDKQLMSFVRTQNIQAHSSGEAEYYGHTSVGVEVLLMFRIFSWLGYPMQMEIQSDSTAAIGICRRKGVRRIKQLEVTKTLVAEFHCGSLSRADSPSEGTHQSDVFRSWH